MIRDQIEALEVHSLSADQIEVINNHLSSFSEVKEMKYESRHLSFLRSHPWIEGITLGLLKRVLWDKTDPHKNNLHQRVCGHLVSMGWNKPASKAASLFVVLLRPYLSRHGAWTAAERQVTREEEAAQTLGSLYEPIKRTYFEASERLYALLTAKGWDSSTVLFRASIQYPEVEFEESQKNAVARLGFDVLPFSMLPTYGAYIHEHDCKPRMNVIEDSIYYSLRQIGRIGRVSDHPCPVKYDPFEVPRYRKSGKYVHVNLYLPFDWADKMAPVYAATASVGLETPLFFPIDLLPHPSGWWVVKYHLEATARARKYPLHRKLFFDGERISFSLPSLSPQTYRCLEEQLYG